MLTPNPFPLDLSGRTAVITGAGGIMCSHFAGALSQAHATVCLLDINLPAAQAAADALTAAGYRAYAYRADVLDKAQLESVHAQILAAHGPCSILINGAGGNHPDGNTEDEYFRPEAVEPALKTFFQLDLNGFRRVFDLNFIGTVLPSQIFSADMTGRKDGCIINISSMNAIRPLTKLPAYSAAKSAVSNFTQWLAVYFSRAGIRVNAIAPGFFITNQNRPNLLHADGSLTPRAEKILSGIPAGRFGDISELTGALLFLLSPQAAGYVNGIVLPVDGGFSAYAGV